MAVKGPRVEISSRVNAHDPKSSASVLQPVSLAATNYVAQIAAGSPINSTGPFTTFTPTRVPQIVLGAGGANPVVYTITGTAVEDDTKTQTVTVTATGPGTYVSTKAFSAITSLTSDVNPAGTTDLQAGDTWVWPAARGLHIAVAGNINMQADEDPAVQVITGAVTGEHPWRVKRINIASTTATGLTLEF